MNPKKKQYQRSDGIRATTRVADDVYGILEQLVAKALIELLEKKHLYQYVNVDIKPLAAFFQKQKNQMLLSLSEPTFGGSRNAGLGDLAFPARKADGFVDSPWMFRAREEMTLPDQVAYGSGMLELPLPSFELPTIQIPCGHCEAVLPPHNPGQRDKNHAPHSRDLADGSPCTQIFILPYECQACKGEPIFFLIRREGTKLMLVGRSHFQEILVPKFIPKEIAKYYKAAIVSFRTNHVLAGLFYLRTLTEQFMRGVIKPTTRITGEKLATLYARSLSSDFRKRFPSLKKIYCDLSEAIHDANEDVDLFQRSFTDIEKHFDAKRIFEATEN